MERFLNLEINLRHILKYSEGASNMNLMVARDRHIIHMQC